MSEALARIHSRGHWRITVRPTVFVPQREPDLALLSQWMQRSAVSFRGWDFPHIDRHIEPRIGADHVEQATDWHHHIELWRIYQSGQFVAHLALWEDWEDVALWSQPPAGWRPGTELRVLSSVFTLAEVCEFASRLAGSSVGHQKMVIEVALKGMEGRRLVIRDQSRGELEPPKVASIKEYTLAREMPRDELTASPSDLSLGMARELFMRFGWSAEPNILRDMLREISR